MPLSSRGSLAAGVAVGVAVVAGGALLGLYALGRREQMRLLHATRPVTWFVRVPAEHASCVIGRAGSNVKEIERKTNTRIRMKDEMLTETDRVFEVSGCHEDVTLAEILIQQTWQNQPRLETLTMRIPYAVVGRVIGSGGETVRTLQTNTRCKIDIARGPPDEDNLTDVNLRGTSDQVDSARRLIEEIVAECQAKEERANAAVTNNTGSLPRTPRLPYRQPLFLTSDSASPSLEVLSGPRKDQYESLQPAAGYQKMGVFVANASDPERFFVQKTGTASIALDKLAQEMTTYYEDNINRSLCAVCEVAVGDLVAAAFPDDNQFYRAKVTEVIVDGYDEDKVELELEYVDFADSGRKSASDVFELKTEFLKLNFQAIECSLYNVQPTGESWSEDALDFFERATFMAQWKELMAEVMSFKTVGTARIPIVQLVSHHSGESINIGDELVRNGHAAYVNAKPSEIEEEPEDN